MNFETIITDCIRRSPDISAKSAAEYIGVSHVTFGRWRRCTKTGRFPNPEHLIKIAELSGHSLPDCMAYYMAARAENKEASKTYEGLAA